MDSIKYTIEFSEAVIGFTIEDITVNNGTKGEFTKESETTYTIVVTNDTDCIQTVTVAEGVCTDVANNQNIQGSKEININRTVPTVVISPNGSSATRETNVTITASGAVGLRADNEYKYCLTQNQTLQGNETWQDYTSGQAITIGTGLNGTYYIHTKKIYDVAGNYSEAVTSNPFIFDNTAPTCSITCDNASPINASTLTYTIKFSENVTGFTASDITVTNGTKGTLSGSGANYTLTVTTSANQKNTQTVKVGAGVCTDSTGNTNIVSNTISIAIDRVAPTCSITAYVSGSNVINTIRFSESVTGFTASDIIVSNGTKGSFSGSGTTYSLTVTGGSEGTQSVRVGANACTDSAGNGNTASNTKNVTISTTQHVYKDCSHRSSIWVNSSYTCPYCGVTTQVIEANRYGASNTKCVAFGCDASLAMYVYIKHECTYYTKTVN